MAKVQLLSSGYWLVRFSANQFFQWPAHRAPVMSDGFGWLTPAHLIQAQQLTEVPHAQ